jgi:hypothetical protein
MSAYKNAIDLTMDTIARRAKSYRNLVVAVVFTGFCPIVWAVATGRGPWNARACSQLEQPDCG